jgi:diadenosine tetraphosphate (Ap4A) HIT family hydrolase
MNATRCPFCSKLDDPAALAAPEVVWGFPHSVALLGSWQFYHGYCVLVSRRHAAELSGLDDATRRAFLEEMCLLARAIETAFRPVKLNYELLGNQVPHLHWHLFPRYAEDPDARRPVWFALDRAESDAVLRERLQTGRQDAAATAAALRQALRDLGAPHA